MTKRIKHTSELPRWFNLAKYEFTKNLDALGWYKQLITRDLHLSKIDKISNLIPAKPNQEEILQAIIPHIRTNPNVSMDDHIVLSTYTLIHRDTPEHAPKNPEQMLGVYPLKSKKSPAKPISDIYQIDYNFSDEFLIENFKRCLAIARKKQKSIYRNPYRQTDFKNWTKLGILPYIDLYMVHRDKKTYNPPRFSKCTLSFR